MAKKQDLSKLDLYGLLNVKEDATEKEILKAYRKQALKCHPDKNPDNPKAAEEFHSLTEALEVLTDPAAKAAYDKIQKAKHAAQLRHRQFDAKRKKFKDDLDKREKESSLVKDDEVKAAYNLEKEIDRLRKEGNAILKQAQEDLKREMEEADRLSREMKVNVGDSSDGEEETTAKIKAKWKIKKGEEKDEGYTTEDINSLFSKYGEVLNVVRSVRKSGTAIIEFASPFSADLAMKNETGKSDFPLSLNWLSGKPASPSVYHSQGHTETASGISPSADTTTAPPIVPQFQNSGSEPLPTNHRDFESLVLMKMRQAEERKRLIQQMENDDGDG